MDPLSGTASIIAVLQLSAKVLGYLNDVKDASKERAKCAVEASNIHNLLFNLRFRLEEGSADAPWFTAVRALGVENGPLDQFKQALEALQTKMTDGGRLVDVGKALVWNFKKEEITSILDRLERLKTLVGIALQMDHLKLSQAIKDDIHFTRAYIPAIQSGVDKIQQDQADARHNEMVADRRGLANGFLDAPEFAIWLSKPSGTLFCPGIPGAGKTMMAAVAINHLLKSVQSSSVGVAYVYCNYKAQEEQDASSLLAAVIKQLVQVRPSAAEPVEQLHKQHANRGTKPSLEEIFSTLRQVVAKHSTVYVVVDALDECRDRDGTRRLFLARLRDLQAEQDVRVMATARFIPEIEAECRTAVKLEIRASNEDVRRFVAGQIYRLPKCIQHHPALRKMVEEKISDRVDGIFLLARLHVDSLSDKSTAKKVKMTLANLSKGSAALDDAYKDALVRIQSQLDGHYELARKVLSWITYARRPLTTAELCCALAVEPNEAELDPDNLPNLDDLLYVCAGLVVVDRESAVIRLVHYTTQEYFERFRDTWDPSAQLHIVSTCLTYLSFDEFKTGSCSSYEEFEERLQKSKFLGYAARYWGEHAVAVEGDVCALVCSFLSNRCLVSSATQAFSAQAYLAPMHKYSQFSQFYAKNSTGAHLAAQLGLSLTLKALLSDEGRESKSELTKEDSMGQTVLYLAIKNGHYGTAKLLINKGADVDAQGGDCGNPLQAASLGGNEAIVTLLLKQGANVNAQGGHYGKALSAALAEGDEVIVTLLLKQGANVNAQGGQYGNALKAAALGGHEAVVKLLLEKGADRTRLKRLKA